MSTEDTNDDQLAEAAPPAGGAEGQEQAQRSWWEKTVEHCTAVLVYYFLTNFFKHDDSDFYKAREIKFAAEFKGADQNSDLVLSRDEVSSWLKQKGEEARKTVRELDKVVEDIFANFDKDKDGLLSYEETPVPYFKKADLNSDMFLSRDEQASFLKLQSEKDLKEMEDLDKMMDGIFKRADKDRDGFISQYEFSVFYGIPKSDDPELSSKPSAEFKQADLNTDMVLSRDEISSHFKQVMKMVERDMVAEDMEKKAEDFFTINDKDRDGQISHQEFDIFYSLGREHDEL